MWTIHYPPKVGGLLVLYLRSLTEVEYFPDPIISPARRLETSTVVGERNGHWMHYWPIGGSFQLSMPMESQSAFET